MINSPVTSVTRLHDTQEVTGSSPVRLISSGSVSTAQLPGLPEVAPCADAVTRRACIGAAVPSGAAVAQRAGEGDNNPPAPAYQPPDRPWGSIALLASLTIIAACLALAGGGWPAVLLILLAGVLLLGTLSVVVAESAPGDAGVRR